MVADTGTVGRAWLTKDLERRALSPPVSEDGGQRSSGMSAGQKCRQS